MLEPSRPLIGRSSAAGTHHSPCVWRSARGTTPQCTTMTMPFLAHYGNTKYDGMCINGGSFSCHIFERVLQIQIKAFFYNSRNAQGILAHITTTSVVFLHIYYCCMYRTKFPFCPISLSSLYCNYRHDFPAILEHIKTHSIVRRRH